MVALWVFAAITVGLAARMLWYLKLSLTNALWVDQWAMLEELWQFHDGRSQVSYLWAPYWGHRILIPRLIFFLDEKLFHYSNVPLVVINMLAQCFTAAILMLVQWRLLNARSRVLAIFTMTATAHVVFSALQLENFVYGMSVQYTVGFASGFASIIFFGLSMREGGQSRGLTWAAIASALISSLTIAAGILAWAVLIAVAVFSRARRGTLAILAGAACLVAAVYAIGYTSVSTGMGVWGAVQRPGQALLIASMFLGGPISLMSLPAGEWVGALGMLVTLCLCVSLLRKRGAVASEQVVLVSLCLFLVLVSGTIVVGRITPEFVASYRGIAPLPSRYLIVPCVFWSCLFPAVLAADWPRVWSRATTLTVGLVILVLTIGTVNRQLEASQNWLNFCRLLDIAAGGLLVGAADQEYMDRMYPDQRLLDRWTPYLRKQRLSIFAERRAGWIGRQVGSDFKVSKSVHCSGQVDVTKPTEHSTFRLTGRVRAVGGSASTPFDLIFAEQGTVIGVGRTFGGWDHPSEVFVGYLKSSDPQLVSRYLVLPDNSLCVF